MAARGEQKKREKKKEKNHVAQRGVQKAKGGGKVRAKKKMVRGKSQTLPGGEEENITVTKRGRGGGVATSRGVLSPKH